MIMFNFLLNAVSKEFQVSRLINNKSHTVRLFRKSSESVVG